MTSRVGARSGRRGPERTVRPRAVWAGMILAIAGAGMACMGGVRLSWAWSVAGALLLVIGAGVAWRAGILRDTHSGDPRTELDQVARGGVRQGTSPGETLSSDAARRTSRAMDRRRLLLERAAHTAPRPGLVRPAAGLLLLAAVFLLVSQWELYPLELPGQTNAGRALGCAIVIGACGMHVLESGPRRPHRVAGASSAVAGLLLLLNGVLADHDARAVAAVETVVGLLICLAGAVVLTARGAGRGVR